MEKKLPAKAVINQKNYNNKTIFCFAYEEDLDQAYAFYCARYENIKYDDFLNLGFTEFKRKLGSIPKTEPLYDIIKSRTISLSKIKDKDERKYWSELKRLNAIPQIYLSTREIISELKNKIKENKMEENINGKRFN